MLFKHSSPAAREATLVLPGGDEADAALPREEPRPSEEEAMIAALSEANDGLRREIASLKAGWQEDLAAAEERARSAAALAHVADDEKRLSQLTASLDSARRAFEDALHSRIGQAAAELAATALAKLVAVRREDGDWLQRIVEQRLARIDRSALVSLRIAPDAFGAVPEAALPPGTLVEQDATLRPGSARLLLRLGTVEIDSDGGLQQLLSLLREGDADD